MTSPASFYDLKQSLQSLEVEAEQGRQMHRGGSVLFLTGETRISLQDSPVIPVKAAESESKVSNCTQRRDKNSAVVQHWIANSLQI